MNNRLGNICQSKDVGKLPEVLSQLGRPLPLWDTREENLKIVWIAISIPVLPKGTLASLERQTFVNDSP